MIISKLAASVHVKHVHTNVLCTIARHGAAVQCPFFANKTDGKGLMNLVTAKLAHGSDIC